MRRIPVVSRQLFANSGGPLAVVAALGLGTTPHDAFAAGLAAAGTAATVSVVDLRTQLREDRAREREAAASAVLTMAADECRRDLREVLAELRDSPILRRIADVATSAAEEATYDEKIWALGLVLGRAWDSARVEEQVALLTQALVVRTLEDVHAATLVLIGGTVIGARDSPGPGEVWSVTDILGQIPLGKLIHPVMQTLTAHGLITDEGAGKSYKTTIWGDTIVGVLEEAASADPEAIVRP